MGRKLSSALVLGGKIDIQLPDGVLDTMVRERHADTEVEKNTIAEHHLIAAVLERAVRDYLSNDARASRDAESWFFGAFAEGNRNPFSFRWICEQLEVPSEEFVRVLARKKAEAGDEGITLGQLAH